MIRFTLGDLRLSVLDGGRIWLDGGAMFGVVPRVLWQRERPPDEAGRIELAMNLLLVEDGAQRVLVDTGAGTKWDAKGRDMYRISGRSAEDLLEPAGLAPDDIDVLVNTHLHFDHAGGNTRLDERGRLVAAFPRATYVVQRGDLDVARWRNERTRASYLEENFEPLVREDRFRLVEGDVWLTPWLRLRPAPGHTPHMQAPMVVTAAGTVAFLADLVPTTSHLRFPYIMAYDLEPLVTLATKKALLPEAAREGWQVVFEHDPVTPIGQLEQTAGRIVARAPVLET